MGVIRINEIDYAYGNPNQFINLERCVHDFVISPSDRDLDHIVKIADSRQLAQINFVDDNVFCEGIITVVVTDKTDSFPRIVELTIYLKLY